MKIRSARGPGAAKKTSVALPVKSVYTYSPLPQQPNASQGCLIAEFSRSHCDTPESVELLWTRDRSVAETSIWQHTTLTQKTDPSGIRTPQSQQAIGACVYSRQNM